MDTVLEATTRLEACVIDQIDAPIFSCDDGVVSLRTFAHIANGLIPPFAIGTKDVDSALAAIGTEVEFVIAQYGSLSTSVLVRTIWLVGTEDAHLVAAKVVVILLAALGQSPVADKKEVVSIDIFNVGTLA